MKFTPEELTLLSSEDAGRFHASSVAEAFAFCRKLALAHYENFPVGSVLVPRGMQAHFHAIYAFSRVGDDIADESEVPERNLLLNRMLRMLVSSYAAPPSSGNPVFTALGQTMHEAGIPCRTLSRLLIAFRRDVDFTPPETFDDLEDYCSYSANPVGELVLRLFGEWNEKTGPLSDKICTGLQLVNFWQDLSVDMKNGRLYIPAELLQRHSLQSEDLLNNAKSANLEKCLDEIFGITRSYFREGGKLIRFIRNRRLRLEIKFTMNTGMLILDKIERAGTANLYLRQKLGKSEFAYGLLRTLFLPLDSRWK